MPKAKPVASSPWNSELRLLAWLATCVSVIAFLFYFKRGDVLLYGDAVAHINIARRVFDSKTPGLLQLGTVWLPLPHLLMIPFLISDEMWRRGAGGSIPSMIGYVFGVIGMLPLTRSTLGRSGDSGVSVHVAAWTGALVFAANPNLIYMQSTAMGESLYLALFIWAVVFFVKWSRGEAKALTKCGLCLAGACLTRYDGWFLAAAMTAVVLARSWYIRQPHRPRGRAALQGRVSGKKETGAWVARASILKFVLIAGAAPALWLAYNGIVYGNPLEFENGPYSAKAIERKTHVEGNPGHPGSGNVLLSTRYFVKSAEDNLAENEGLQRTWILLVLVALVAAVLRSRPNQADAANTSWPLLFLLVPLPFYALSVAYGGVPIFIPNWWPFSYYNVRYGLQLTPAFAMAAAILVYVAVRSQALGRRLKLACVLGILVFVSASYFSIWHSVPICLKEAQVNMRTRTQLETELARWLEKLPADSTLLMYLGDHVGAVERAGIPLQRTINEGNHRVWKQPVDPQGLWERALADPTKYADFVLAFEGDPVWQAVHEKRLAEIVEIRVTGQPCAILYRAR